MDPKVKSFIESEIENNRVVLFMKGTKEQPMCGFSARVVNILQDYDVDFVCHNVLQSEALRQGIKDFSDWPTIPQLFIDGEFIGGCDIVTEMDESGELSELLEQGS